MRLLIKGAKQLILQKPNNTAGQALVTKITNQVENISQIINNGDYTFKKLDFTDTLKKINQDDMVYSDPPYTEMPFN
ncbi:MAG: DNA adenine methylase [Bacteroidales bacterium]|nr:DNA adenine methylase [Bacteroidales bacterium]